MEVNQELIMRASFLEKQAQETQGSLEFVERQISELEEFDSDIKSFSKSSGKEMLASVGKGIYVKADLADKDLFVNVGSGVIVKKTPEETEKIVEDQLRKLKEAKTQLTAQLEANNMALMKLITEIESSKDKSKG